MKKNNLIVPVFIAVSTILSCKKEETNIVNPIPVTEQKFQSKNIKWSDLPIEYRNAEEAETATTEAEIKAARSASDIISTEGPYGNIKGSSFGIFPAAGSNITAMGIRVVGDSIVENITIWYKNSSGTLYKKHAGKNLDTSAIDFYELTNDEYINYFACFTGQSGGYLSHISFATNKLHFVGGGYGTPPNARPGTWVFGFWGYADKSRVYQLNLDIHCKPWNLVNGSDGKDIAVAANGTAYMVNNSGKIYKMSSSATTWTQIAGSDASSIAANGSRVCMVNTAGKIYELIGSTWRQLPGSDAVDITIDSDNKLYMTNTAGSVYNYNDAGGAWYLKSANIDAVRISAYGGVIWMVNANGDIYRWTAAYQWSKQPGSDAKDIALGDDGYAWLTNTSGLIYRMDANRLPTEICGSSGRTIAVNNKKVMMVNTSGLIYKLNY